MSKQVTLSVIVILLFGLLAQGVSAQSPDPNEGFLQVNIAVEGAEIFERPSQNSKRELAVLGEFAPYVAGRDRSGSWLFVYYFEGDDVEQGWIAADQLTVTADQIAALNVVNAYKTPKQPILTPDPLATVPVSYHDSSSGNSSSDDRHDDSSNDNNHNDSSDDRRDDSSNDDDHNDSSNDDNHDDSSDDDDHDDSGDDDNHDDSGDDDHDD